MTVSMRRIVAVLGLLLLAAWGCAGPQVREEALHTVYRSSGLEGSLISRYAPVFLIYQHHVAYNRIGRPSAKFDRQGNQQIYIDTTKPTIYYMVREFSTSKGPYTNLMYRVHFPRIPFSLVPFFLSTGKNMGLMVVVTLDRNHRPVLVTTVQTCGCYVAIVPTSYLPCRAYPPGWKNKPIKVYGERLPWLLDYCQAQEPKLLVHIRPGTHRVMDLEVVEAALLNNPNLYSPIKTPFLPMSALERIPIDGKTTSFYYQKGPLRGHVKGSVKPWESLLLGLITFDLFVGADKAYADSKVTGNPFYTSLKPWNRNSSDMWNFPGFLKFWGWRL